MQTLNRVHITVKLSDGSKQNIKTAMAIKPEVAHITSYCNRRFKSEWKAIKFNGQWHSREDTAITWDILVFSQGSYKNRYGPVAAPTALEAINQVEEQINPANSKGYRPLLLHYKAYKPGFTPGIVSS